MAQDLLDLLQKVRVGKPCFCSSFVIERDPLVQLLDHAPLEPRFRAVLYVALVRLCRKSELYPRCFSLDDVNINLQDIPLSNGGFSEVYSAQYNGKPVCAKVVRMYQSSNQAFLRKVHGLGS